MRDTILRYRSSNTINIVIFKNLIVKNIVKNSLSNVSENLQQFEPKPQPEMYCHIFKNIDPLIPYHLTLIFLVSRRDDRALQRSSSSSTSRTDGTVERELQRDEIYIIFPSSVCCSAALSLSLSLPRKSARQLTNVRAYGLSCASR